MKRPTETQPPTSAWKKWLKRGGIGLFLFFLLKGLAWLIIPSLLLYFCS